MKARYHFTASDSRFGLVLVIVLTVTSLQVITLVNPAAKASSYSTDGNIFAPSTISQAFSNGQDNGFATQAALSGVWARQTNNIVGAQSYYDVVFLTSTTGTIKFIDITFPPGTIIGAPINVAEREGIGAGSAEKTSATQIRYTVTSAVSVAEGTKIRLEFFNIVNPTAPSTGYKVTVTTRNAAGTVIDGPTLSNSLNMKQIGTEQIADNAVTGSKIAGTDKLIFGTCIGSLPALEPGSAAGAIACQEPNADPAFGDQVVATWNVGGGNPPYPILVNATTFFFSGSNHVFFGFSNPSSVMTPPQPNMNIGYIIFNEQ